MRISETANSYYDVNWTPGSVGNCGMQSVIGFSLRKYSKAAANGSGYGGGFGYDKKATIPELYEVLKKNFDEISRQMYPAQTGMVFLSDRVATAHQTSFSEGGLGQAGSAVLDTLWWIKAIRDLRKGTLVTSPIVQNPNHPGQSAIIAAIWVPHDRIQHIMHDKIGLRRTEVDVLKGEARKYPNLFKNVETMVREFYGTQDPTKKYA